MSNNYFWNNYWHKRSANKMGILTTIMYNLAVKIVENIVTTQANWITLKRPTCAAFQMVN